MSVTLRRILFIGCISFLFICTFATPAFAHSQIVSSNPSNGQDVKSSPKKIEITYNEDIQVIPGSIRVFDGRGKMITPRGSVHAEGKVASLEIPSLQRGTYAVAWNVISADTHPVHGAFTFSVDSALNSSITNNKSFAKILNGAPAESFAKTGFNGIKFFIFVFISIVVAIIFFRVFLLKDIFSRALDRLFLLSAVLGSVFGIASILFYSAIAKNESLSSVLTDHHLLSSKFRTVATIQVAVFLLLIPLWKQNFRFTKYLFVVLGFVLCITPALQGHGSAGKYVLLAFPLDNIHVIAASIWFGGLLIIPFILRHKNGIEAVKKFSSVALVCVIALTITGAFAWWRQVGSISATTSTWFGQLVLFKIVIFLVVLCAAWFSRRHIHALVSHGGSGTENDLLLERKSLKRCVYLETILLIAVMVATSILVTTIPGRESLNQPVSKQVVVATGYMDITIDPVKAGPTDIHVYMLNKNGTPYQVSNTGASLTNDVITATLSNKARGVTALPVTMKFEGLNHFVSVGASIPFPGTWTLTVRIQTSAFDEEVGVVHASIHA